MYKSSRDFRTRPYRTSASSLARTHQCTMTDPFSFIGACAAIVQLTSSGSRAAIVLSEICRNSQSTADTIDSYLTELDCFIDVAEKIRSERRSTTLDIRMEKLMKDYVSQTTSLQNLLRPLVMAQGSSRSAKILKSVKYQHKSKKIEHLIHAIERKIALLMYYHGPLEGIAVRLSKSPRFFQNSFCLSWSFAKIYSGIPFHLQCRYFRAFGW